MRVVYIPDAVRRRRVFHWHFAYLYAVMIHLLGSDFFYIVHSNVQSIPLLVHSQRDAIRRRSV